MARIVVASFIGKLFGKKPKSATHFMTAKLNARVQPIDRGELFEDPLNELLVFEKLGEVVGGGTMLVGDPQGIAYCDIEIGTYEHSDATVARVVAMLEGLGVPKGSELMFKNRVPIPFGSLEGMAIFLNGTDLAEEVYQKSDVNKTIDALNFAMSGVGGMKGHWQGNRETALYFYGWTFSAMTAAVEEVLADDPLCERCRIEQIA
jgi:hypothetical protein